MASTSIIANKYARAAFNIAKKDGLIENFLSDLKLFTDNFKENFIKELSSPEISRSALGEVIAEVSKKLAISPKVTQFLITIAAARRIKLINEIYKNFSYLTKIDKNILETEVISVITLNDKQLEEIKSTLQKKYPGKIIEINQAVDKDILGGVIIKIGSLVIDSSLKNQLAQIMAKFQSEIK